MSHGTWEFGEKRDYLVTFEDGTSQEVLSVDQVEFWTNSSSVRFKREGETAAMCFNVRAYRLKGKSSDRR